MIFLLYFINGFGCCSGCSGWQLVVLDQLQGLLSGGQRWRQLQCLGQLHFVAGILADEDEPEIYRLKTRWPQDPRLLIPYKVYIPKVYIPCIPWLRITRGKQGIKYNLLLFHSRSSSSSIGSSWGHCLRCLSTAPNSLRMYDANTETDLDASNSSDATQDALGDY